MVEETEDQVETVEEAEVVEYDWDKIKLLLDIIESSRGHPNLKPINDAALAELERIANPPAEEGEAEEVTEAEQNPAPTERKKEKEEKDE